MAALGSDPTAGIASGRPARLRGTSVTPKRGTEPARQGKIEVTSRAIASVAGRAVSECYGVVGVAARRPRLTAVEILRPEQYWRGVDVRFADGTLSLDVYVVLEYGLRISEIAHNIMANVKFAVERTLEIPVARVNVNVQALRMSRD